MVKQETHSGTYTLAVQRTFVAWHFLVGGDWGPENHPHGHDYVVEIQLEACRLDEHGYLIDIVHVEALLDDLVSPFFNLQLELTPYVQNHCHLWHQFLLVQIWSLWGVCAKQDVSPL